MVGRAAAGPLPAAISSRLDSRPAGSPSSARLPPPPLSGQWLPPLPHPSPLPQLPTSSAPPPAPFALIHPSIQQTSAERQGPLRPGERLAVCRRTKQSPGGFRRIPGLVWAPPPTPSPPPPQPRPPPFDLHPALLSLSTLARGPWGCESSSAPHVLLDQTGSSPSCAFPVWRPPEPHSQP